jgi:hypothetical protein
MSIDRRGFLAVCAAGAIETAFHARVARGWAYGQGELLRAEGETVAGLDADRMAILRYASLAPSGHNAQPWAVKIIEPDRWTLCADASRRLPAVDPANRELLLSIGAFAENLHLAAGAIGYDAQIDVIAKTSADEEVIELRLTKTEVRAYPLERLRKRRVVKRGQLTRNLSREDLGTITEPLGDRFVYFPQDSEHAKCMREGAVASFRKQSERDDAQEELSRWVRFSNDAAREHRDGLTTEGMEIGGLSALFVKLFMTNRSVMGDSFRKRSVDMVAAQAGEGAGWLVITSAGSTPADIVDAGRRFEQMFLLARERRIAIHPMTQMLEEDLWRRELDVHAGIVPQFILRLGYLDEYPDPVSPRRPVSWFTVAG